jgi:hypothetical protein
MSLWSWFKSRTNHRGHILDLLVFLANLFLLARFTNQLQRLGLGFANDDATAARGLGWVVLVAFIAYTLGAILKRAPLHARVGCLPNPDYAGCLFLIWISLHISLTILGASLIAASFNTAPKGVLVFVMIIGALLPTFFVIRVLFRPKKLAEIPAWRKKWPMELMADLLIVAAVLMLTIMWNIWIEDLFLVQWAGSGFSDRLFAAVLSAGAFAMFYLTPRFLFLTRTLIGGSLGR